MSNECLRADSTASKYRIDLNVSVRHRIYDKSVTRFELNMAELVLKSRPESIRPAPPAPPRAAGWLGPADVVSCDGSLGNLHVVTTYCMRLPYTARLHSPQHATTHPHAHDPPTSGHPAMYDYRLSNYNTLAG